MLDAKSHDVTGALHDLGDTTKHAAGEVAESVGSVVTAVVHTGQDAARQAGVGGRRAGRRGQGRGRGAFGRRARHRCRHDKQAAGSAKDTIVSQAGSAKEPSSTAPAAAAKTVRGAERQRRRHRPGTGRRGGRDGRRRDPGPSSSRGQAGGQDGQAQREAGPGQAQRRQSRRTERGRRRPRRRSVRGQGRPGHRRRSGRRRPLHRRGEGRGRQVGPRADQPAGGQEGAQGPGEGEQAGCAPQRQRRRRRPPRCWAG